MRRTQQPQLDRRRPESTPQSSSWRLDREILPALTSVRDSFSSRQHSLDFTYAHATYLRTRVLAVCALFILLVPVWTLVDIASMPRELVTPVIQARAGLLAGLLVVLFIAWSSRESIRRIHLCAGGLLALPALFYAFVLWLVPPGTELSGYGFIPFLLVATLSVFPFTILESLVMGLAMIGLLIIAQLADSTWLTPWGLEDLWLIVSLLLVAMAANHFQLSLLMRVYRQATHDPLTGLFNRGALASYLDKVGLRQETDGSKEAGGDCALLLLDIDHFKQVNDTHGHSVGDLVLAEFAGVLLDQTRAEDCVARYGGEEFVVVLEHSDMDSARGIAERIRQAVADHHFPDHKHERVPLTTSIGIAPLRPGDVPQEALERADQALYQAKAAGRNRVISVTT